MQNNDDESSQPPEPPSEAEFEQYIQEYRDSFDED